VCIGLGVWLVTDPMFRQNPKALSFSDLLPGIGAIIVGLVMLGLSVLVIRRR
jgi:hypothetical protein